MEVKSRRKDLLSLLLAVFLLGVVISLVANILFDIFYDSNKKLFITIVLLVLFINLTILVYISNLSSISEKKAIIKFVYNFEEKGFIDIPYNPASVNARMAYYNLSDKKRESISEKFMPIWCNTIEPENRIQGQRNFDEFCISAVITLIFTRFFQISDFETDMQKMDINSEYFKELLYKFRYIDIDNLLGTYDKVGCTCGCCSKFMEDESNLHESDILVKIEPVGIYLPEGFKIKEVNESNIKLESKYGFIIFEWDIVRRSISEETTLLSALELLDLDNCEEVEVNLKMKYGFKLMKLFKKSTVQFERFVNRCCDKMLDYDISKSLAKLEARNSTLITIHLNSLLYEEEEDLIDVDNED
ncbi:hypothetical protein [Romboutsia sp. MSSM.1001216sp_RTP31141st1_G3_RTP31141_220114]|uniref:hypothetical protein n=1 Tax=unclassified Romboutsia TaxID=2626894 RepID=UPI0031B5ED62